MRGNRYFRRFGLLVATLLLATACSLEDEPEPTPELMLLSPTAEQPTATLMETTTVATAALAPTTPVISYTPTDTELGILPTDTPEPTATHTPLGILPTDTPEPTRPPTQPPPPTAAVNAYLDGSGGGVYVRDAPGTLGNVLQVVSGSAPLTIVGRTSDSRWLEVRFDGGNRGWVLVDSVVTSVNLNTIGVTGVANNAEISGNVRYDAGGLRLREQPSSTGNIVDNLPALEPLIIRGRLENGVWLQVALNDNQEGWVMTEYVDINGNLDDIPVVGASLIPAESFDDAEVIAEGDGLRLRDAPDYWGSSVLANLPSFTQLKIIGRTGDNTWLQVRTPDGGEGWVWGNYLRVRVDLNAVPITGEAVVYEMPDQPPPGSGVPAPSGIISNITPRAREIFIRGQSLGNRANVFSKVGDSLTDTPYMFGPIGWGAYNLAGHTYLQPVINYFTTANARDGNSFVNGSFAARAGWSTPIVLDPSQTDPAVCRPGETPLECEYRIVKPSIALIMLGTNDRDYLPVETFRANMERIVQISIDRGVIPVLSTLPDRYNMDMTAFNNTILEIAYTHSIPIWDLRSALLSLPNQGRGEDNVHLSSPPPGDYNLAGDFRPEHMQYGYVVRNFTALQVLDAIWRQVIMSG